MKPSRDSPIFSRMQVLLIWVVRTTRRFPRDQRFGLAQRILQQAFRLEDQLVTAAVDRENQKDRLLEADIALTGLRRSLLLAHEMGFLSDGQLRHATEMLAEIGRLLGGWRKR
ncbi:MAG: diversity-generating retroelement protein Avd [Acidobacteriota bacterium]|nr:diversity-generating retroelement protein Avd [Acidobacteriota bacterium]